MPRGNDNIADILYFDAQCVCVCVFCSHSFWTSSSLDVPAGVTQEEGQTGFFILLPSAVRALIFSREGFSYSSPSSTVKSTFCDLIVLHSLGFFFFFFLARNIPFTGIELTSQRVRRLRGYL